MMFFRQPHVWLKFNAPKWMPNWVGRPFEKLFDAELWVRNRIEPKRMHHVVFTDLRPGWHDVDEVMTEAMIKLLRQFVEEESGGIDKLIKFTDDLQNESDNPEEGREFESGMLGNQAERQSEVVTLYQWFTVTRPALQKEYNRLVHRYSSELNMHFTTVPGTEYKQITFDPLSTGGEIARKESSAIEKQLRDETTEMLVRLVRIRESLWT